MCACSTQDEKKRQKPPKQKCLQAESLPKQGAIFLNMALQATLLYFQVCFKVFFPVSLQFDPTGPITAAFH